MLKELATIRDKEEVTGFLMFDGMKNRILDVEEAKQKASEGQIDTLGYKDGKFIPILQGDILNEMKGLTLHRWRKICQKMTFEEFVNADCLFRKSDIDLMKKDEDIVLATICNAFEAIAKTGSKWFLTVSFYGQKTELIDRVQGKLAKKLFHNEKKPVSRRSGNFLILNVMFETGKRESDSFVGIQLWEDLMKLMETEGIKFIWNPETLRNIGERVNLYMSTMPVIGCLLGRLIPTEKGLHMIFALEREMNRMTSAALLKQGITYKYEKDYKA